MTKIPVVPPVGKVPCPSCNRQGSLKPKLQVKPCSRCGGTGWLSTGEDSAS